LSVQIDRASASWAGLGVARSDIVCVVGESGSGKSVTAHTVMGLNPRRELRPVAGSVLLLMRRKSAVPVFIASFVSMIVTLIHNYGFAGAADITGATGTIFSVIIFVVALGLILYSRNLAGKGVLS